MGSDLFRREALQARQESWLGSVHLSTTRLAAPMAVLAAVAMLALLLLLVLGTHTRKQRVQGQLLPAGGLHTVAASVSGITARRLVEEGDRVTHGQPLLEISADIDVPGAGGAVAEQVAAALTLQRDRLQADLSDLATAQEQRAQALQVQLDTIQQQLAAARDELAVRTRQAQAAGDTLDRIRPLRDQRIVSQVQVQQYEDQALNAQAQRELALRSRLELERSLALTRQELDDLPLQIRERGSEIERALADVSRALALNQAEHRVQVRASAPGVVSGLAVDEGQSVAQGQRLLSIVPEGATLEAELWVPSRAVGSIQTGDRVAIRYQAFPYQAFGVQSGRIRWIGGSALTPDEMRARSGIDPGEPVYRVLVGLDSGHPEHKGQPLPLRPHMLLDADLLLERRRLYQLVFDPFRHARNSAGRADRRQEAP